MHHNFRCCLLSVTPGERRQALQADGGGDDVNDSGDHGYAAFPGHGFSAMDSYTFEGDFNDDGMYGYDDADAVEVRAALCC